ncbi:hypothetical protein COCOBI_04-1420 [Coccomyxa sp. Obi]|nr:hypothetical protein COCOBI_04-1420 [Coccomyxa sp. Obi]
MAIPEKCNQHVKVLHRPGVVRINLQHYRKFQCSAQILEGATPRLFVFGLGYTGRRIAKLCNEKGWEVAGTCRSLEGSHKFLQYDGIHAFPYDPGALTPLSTQALHTLQRSTHILSSVPPTEGNASDPILAGVGPELKSCSSITGLARWVGYLSSTGVYGDWQGEWVDERSELRASKGKGHARVLAEAAWRQMWEEHRVPVHIFRLGGIYGPGRSAIDAAALQPGQASGSQRRRAMQRCTSRCHVYDICQTLMASMERPRPGAVYNVVDDDPASRAEVMAYAKQLLQGKRARARSPLTEPLTKSEPSSADERKAEFATSRAGEGAKRPQLEEKRVRNDLIKEELGVKLEFPTYKEGLAAIQSGDKRPLEFF